MSQLSQRENKVDNICSIDDYILFFSAFIFNLPESHSSSLKKTKKNTHSPLHLHRRLTFIAVSNNLRQIPIGTYIFNTFRME